MRSSIFKHFFYLTCFLLSIASCNSKKDVSQSSLTATSIPAASSFEIIHLTISDSFTDTGLEFGDTYLTLDKEYVVFTINNTPFMISRSSPIHFVYWPEEGIPTSFYYLPELSLFLQPIDNSDRKNLLTKTITIHIIQNGLRFPISLPYDWCVRTEPYQYQFQIPGAPSHLWGRQDWGEIECPKIPIDLLRRSEI